MNASRVEKRNAKIARTLVRLKYSLMADEEIDNILDQQKELIKQGVVPQLETTLGDILNESA